MAVSREMGSAQSTGSDAISRSQGTHRGMAFLIEALVVLAFLMMSLAVFVRLFSSAQLEGVAASKLSQAVLVATNVAEEFSVDPLAVPKELEQDGFAVTCDVEANKNDAGTLYDATIDVSDGTGVVYTLQTSRFVSTSEGGAL